MTEWASLAALVLAGIPAGLFVLNTLAFRRLPPATPASTSSRSAISILIPARNEEATLGPALDSILRQTEVPIEVLVLDDHSTDGTARVIEERARHDSRLRGIRGAELPPDWCGKQHACWQLASEARHNLLLFLDADVRLTPGSLDRLERHLADHPHLQLLSGFPRQLTGTLLERLLIPLIHFVLLGYLPIPAARRLKWTAFAAGCGQFFMARRDAYRMAGGHHAIRASLHDGVKLPRAFRAAGFSTDIVDATDLAECRMYHSALEVWRGLGKNATEGMAHPMAIVPWTILLFGGHIAPWLLLALSPWLSDLNLTLAATAAVLTLVPRLIAALRFRQPLGAALLHPASVLVLLVIQWTALFRRIQGQPSEWRGRRYAPSGALDSPQTRAVP